LIYVKDHQQESNSVSVNTLIQLKKEQPVVQTKKSAGVPNDTIDLSRGMPLSDAERNYFEPRFGTDFSNVIIHNSERAAGMADKIQAKTFTKGNDIAFAKREYQPQTEEGKSLLAQELTRMIQQKQNREDPINRKENPDKAGLGDKAVTNGLTGAAWLIEKIQVVNRGFFSDFFMNRKLPGTIKSTVNFVENLLSRIKVFSKEDFQESTVRIADINAYIIQAVKAIGTVCKSLSITFEKFIDGVRAVIKGFRKEPRSYLREKAD
jgi:hypothetical protein